MRAIRRYQVGRVPDEPIPRLAPKTVKSVAIMLGSTMTTAVVWKYLKTNPTEHVKAPAARTEPGRPDR